MAGSLSCISAYSSAREAVVEFSNDELMTLGVVQAESIVSWPLCGVLLHTPCDESLDLAWGLLESHADRIRKRSREVLQASKSQVRTDQETPSSKGTAMTTGAVHKPRVAGNNAPYSNSVHQKVVSETRGLEQ